MSEVFGDMTAASVAVMVMVAHLLLVPGRWENGL
jgi:hypothetical protein